MTKASDEISLVHDVGGLRKPRTTSPSGNSEDNRPFQRIRDNIGSHMRCADTLDQTRWARGRRRLRGVGKYCLVSLSLGRVRPSE